MATTNSYVGSSSLSLQASVAFTVDTQGNRRAARALTHAFAVAGGTAPTISGFLSGVVTVSAGDLLLAHASDPLQGMGDAAYSDGFTVAGSKIKAIYLFNCHETAEITVVRGAANGAPIWSAAGAGTVLHPGSEFWQVWKNGLAALSTGSNDKLTLTPSAGSPTMDITVLYGP